jgi:Uma2 family endonuclease
MHMATDRAEVADGPVYMPVEQYLALDESTDGKYEYLDGFVFMLRPPSSAYAENALVDMAGGSVAHAALCARIATLVNVALGDSPCMAYTSDARMKLAEKRYLYPDVTVSCDQEAGSMLANPTVVIEVLSPTTEKRDRGAKFNAYKALLSVYEYMLIGSDYKTIEVHRREGNFWRQYHYREGDMVELASIGVSFPLDDVYRRINLG